MRGSALGKNRVVDAAQQVGAMLRVGISEECDGEDRHTIDVGVQPIDVAVLVASTFDQHFDRECLPRGVSRPPAFILRPLHVQIALEVVVRAIEHVGIHVVAQFLAALQNVNDVRGEIRGCVLTFARPISKAAVAALELVQLDDG